MSMGQGALRQIVPAGTKKTKGRLSFAREKQPSCTGQMLLMIKPCLLTKRHGG